GFQLDVPGLAPAPVVTVLFAELRGRGVGRQLIQHALVWFRAQGLSYALIESMSHNEVGRGLYTSVGFQEIGQLVHYAMKL
ncbi:MAG: N-acetyltransferase, partial [Verrucomicrobia bacterium]|nr:N-acetyltransferase [Verrucomicrobiota bacterium]